MTRQRTPGQPPELYPCRNPDCSRTTPLSVSGYGAGLPNDVNPAKVHEVTEDFGGVTLLCSTCGHFTVVTRYRPPQDT
jgi:hypothetical protein